MSKKTSPQTRPGRRPRRIRAGGTTAGLKDIPRPTQEKPAPGGLKGRLRRYLPVAAVPNAVVVLGIIVMALVGLLFSGTSLAALPATIAQLWLILNLVPVSADGIVLGVLPLLPAMGLIALIARRVRVAVRERVSMADLLVLSISTLAVPLVLTLIAGAMMWDAGRVFDVGAPPLGHAVARTLLVHLIALAIGMGGKLWRALLRRYRAPDWLVDAATAAVRILLLLSAASLVILLVLLAVGWPRQVELAGLYGTSGGVLGTALLSLLYLPNAVIAVITVILGSEFHLGAASVSLYAIDLTELPLLPLMALIPAWAHPWSILLLLVTSITVAYVLGSARFTVAQTLATSVIIAVLLLVGGYLTWGEIGHLGTGGPMVWLTAGLAFAWTAGIGVAAALLGRLADRRAPAVTGEPEEHPTEPTDSEPAEFVDGEIVDVEDAPEDESEDAPEDAGEVEAVTSTEKAEDNVKAEDTEHRD
ncbi:cell division protein PerM [Corynebacterium comes]|uniref:Uncharacterized protein n=1 Tax=Corynebacterium comes TaxID=2675218 RepID=A0A6B8VFJ0_9CORY|nr:DUF6350 family protein [Corynebacterium comes]QGU04022.1 hypothetical protein CETAM_03740 [Corynebacterium comes]